MGIVEDQCLNEEQIHEVVRMLEMVQATYTKEELSRARFVPGKDDLHSLLRCWANIYPSPYGGSRVLRMLREPNSYFATVYEILAKHFEGDHEATDN